MIPPKYRTLSARVIEQEKAFLSSPLIICGFVGPGLAGIISVGYIIGHLGLHQVAHVNSRYIPPSVVFIGGKIRHPFRIYEDHSGKLAVVICEVPIDRRGLYDISAVLIEWLQKYNPKEIAVLDGVPVQGLPEKRTTYYIADEKRQAVLKSLGFIPAESVLIDGTAGSILSACLNRKTPCVSLLVPSSINVTDPGAPLELIRAVNLTYKLNIVTTELEEDVAMVNNELNEIAKQYQKVQEQASADALPLTKTMYG